MTFTYVSFLSKLRTTASVMQSGLLREPIHQGCALKSDYTSKTKETKPAEIDKINRIKHCKQFTTISKILHGRTDMSSNTPNNKISVIGLEAISLATVNALVNQFISDNICLVDIDDDTLNGELLDLKMGALYNGNANIVASKDPAVTANSKICVIFTGTFRQKDEHPNIYAGRSVGIMKVLVPTLVKHSPNMIIVVASNPVDLLSYATWKLSGLPKSRIIGIGTMVDTVRFRCILSQRSGISPTDCYGCIIGEQGENSVPVWSGVTIAGVPLASINATIGTKKDAEEWNEVFQEAVTCDKTMQRLKGYSSWSCGLCIANLCRAILKNFNTIIPVSTHVKGKHGIREDVFLSLPCVIGANGVANVVREALSDEERFQLQQCAENVVNLQKSIEISSEP